MLFADHPPLLAPLPYRLQGIGIDHRQEPVRRPDGFPHWQWIQVMKGVCRLETQTGVTLVRPGDGFLLKPREFHAYHEEKGELVVWWITFDGSGIETALGNSFLDHSGAYRLSEGNRIVELLGQVWDFSADSSRMVSREASILVYTLLMRLCDACSSDGKESPLAVSRRLVPVLDYVRRNFRHELDVDTLAALAGLSAQHLGRLFRQQLGCPPSEYWIRFRISRARELLLEHPEMRIHEVAAETGFKDLNYFSRLFRAREGCSPGEYRRHHGYLSLDRQ